MQTNDKSDGNTSQTKWSSKKNNKFNEQNAIEMKPQLNIDLINSSKTSPNKSSINSTKTNDKKSVNSNNANNSNQNSTQSKRSKGPFVSQLHNQIKARLNLNTSASHKSISSLRPTHVFAVGRGADQSNSTIHQNGRHSGNSSHVCANSSAQLAGRLTLNDGRLRAHDKCCEHSLVHHSFISDITDVRQMENTLLTLLEDFHSGKLQAFGQDITFEKMESVREQQERLARLHFELNLQQEVYGHQTEEGKRLAKDNMSKLIENLQQLSNSMYPFL